MEGRFNCRFGDLYAPVKFIQNGVFKCNAPPHLPGFVKIALMFDFEVISDRSTAPVDDFLYK